MRILSLGCPLPGPAVDNYSFASAPCFFDYAAIVAEPKALSQLIEEIVAGTAEHRTHSGELVLNEARGADTVALAALLRDRRDETERLLERGGLVVCFAYANAVHAGVAGLADCTRYGWLPESAGLAYAEPFVRRGFGTQIAPAQQEHPFAVFVEQFRKELAYQAYFEDVAPGFAGVGRVFARSAGGAAIGIELCLGRGRAVFLPPPAKPPSGDARYAFSSALQEAIRRILEYPAAAEGVPPEG